jgi:NAD(P)-dependent dehydrogenase (short-subunit alcohol dehydrogenase family)
MSSIAAGMSVPNHALYAGSKSAVEGFTRSFAADGGPKRITANAIAPGGIKTDMFHQNAWHYAPGATKDTPIEHIEAGIAKLIPLGRCAVPADIARVVMFLCHDDSEWLNGKTRSSFYSCQRANVETYRSNHPSQRWWCCINNFTSLRFAVETASSPVTY